MPKKVRSRGWTKIKNKNKKKTIETEQQEHFSHLDNPIIPDADLENITTTDNIVSDSISHNKKTKRTRPKLTMKKGKKHWTNEKTQEPSQPKKRRLQGSDETLKVNQGTYEKSNQGDICAEKQRHDDLHTSEPSTSQAIYQSNREHFIRKTTRETEDSGKLPNSKERELRIALLVHYAESIDMEHLDQLLSYLKNKATNKNKEGTS